MDNMTGSSTSLPPASTSTPSSPSIVSSSSSLPFLLQVVVDFFIRLFWCSESTNIAFIPETRLHRSTTELSVYPSVSMVNVDKDIPWLARFYFNFETSYNAGKAIIYSRIFYGIGVTSVVLYLLFIYFGKKFMKNRKPFDLQKPLKYWNLILAIFSLCGAIRVVPHLLYVLHKFGFVTSICAPPVYIYGHGAVGLWVLLFTYSKYVELIDTVFIVLRKKELGFLHWYHHCTVLLYTWDSFYVEQPSGLYFVAMNYSVHTVMYFYYFMAAQCKRRLSWGVYVTVAQITQMFVGVAITLVSLYYVHAYPVQLSWTLDDVAEPLKHGVYIFKGNLICGMLMYSTYFYLFAEFFLNRYLFSSASSTSKPKICTSSPLPAAAKSTDDGGSTHCSTSELSEEDNNKANTVNSSNIKSRRSAESPANQALRKRFTHASSIK
eukprot:GHVS01072930.1.p1 GENE.GHVS01072930.1~~GHVS01072930.1.p1  ORF type:complete len:434 (-),score=57.43 GHVS01072930.1:688-1989(-)